MEAINSSDLEKAIQLLKQNELVAIPTETVYGLAANAFSESAIEKIYQVKQRPKNNPLIVHVHTLNQLNIVAKNISSDALKLARFFWPGPLTLVLDKADGISTSITAGKDTVALRMPNHELTLELLKALEFPLVAPSANRSNHISPTCAEHVRISLGSESPFILDGGSCQNGIESTIVQVNSSVTKILRLGAITKEAIEKVLGREIEGVKESEKEIVSPGMFKKHYSPTTKFVASSSLLEELKKYNGNKIGVLFFKEKPLIDDSITYRILSPQGSMEEASKNLYAYMHELDALGLAIILAEYLPDTGLGKSINDRLKRASSN